MNQYIVTLSFASLLLNILLIALVRHLAISPSFGIPVMAIGRLKLWTTIGPRIWFYGDMDKLGDINDVLTTPQQAGMDRWNELMSWVLRHIRASDQFLVYGGDEFGWSIDPRQGGGTRREANARMFCERIQALLRDAPYTDAERQALWLRTGKPYATITLASAHSTGWRGHRKAFLSAQLRVVRAKPKDRAGQRGEILEALG